MIITKDYYKCEYLFERDILHMIFDAFQIFLYNEEDHVKLQYNTLQGYLITTPYTHEGFFKKFGITFEEYNQQYEYLRKLVDSSVINLWSGRVDLDRQDHSLILPDVSKTAIKI